MKFRNRWARVSPISAPYPKCYNRVRYRRRYMATSQIQLHPKQRQRLARRAKKHGKSLSQEVSSASVPYKTEAELSALARQAKASAGRGIARLDETIAYLDRELKKIRKHSELDTRRTRGNQVNHFDRAPHRCTF
jgi:hypothetical protein